MMLYRLGRLLLCLLLWAHVAEAALPPTGSCKFWPGPAQSFKSSGVLNMTSGGTIKGNPGNKISFPTFNTSGATFDCNGSACTLATQAVPGISLSTFQTSTSGSDYTVQNSSLTLTGNTQGYLRVDSNGTLTLAPTGGGPMLIKGLELNSSSGKLVLTAPAEYWVQNLQVQGGAFEVTGSGDIALYVKNSTSINSTMPTLINTSTQRLGLIVYNQFSLQNGSTLRAALYSSSSGVTLNGNVYGPVTVANSLTINGGGYWLDGTPWTGFSNWGGDCLPIDHYELSYPTVTQVGQSAAITLKACADSACTLYTASSTVNVNTSTSPASTLTWSANPVTFTGQSSGVTLGSSTSTKVTFALGTVTPSATNGLKCYRNGVLDGTCSMDFVAVDHYELHYPATALNCEGASVTVKACQNSDCALLSGNSSQVTLSATGGTPTWSVNPLTFTGSGSVTLSNPSASTVTLGMSSSSPTASNPLKCYKDGVLDGACSLSFVATQFSFNVPTLYAGQESGSVRLRAIQSVPLGSSSVCQAALTGAKSVAFTRSYQQPATGSLNPTIRDSGSGSATTVTSATPVSLVFDANGEALFRLAYADAGVLGLSASWSSAGLTLSGSDNFAVLPEKIVLSASGNSCSGATQDEYLACSKYKMVNEGFTVTGTAGYSSGALVLTPNFGTSHLASAPQIQHSLLAPSSGVTPGQGSTTMSFSGGTGSATYSLADVGVYALGIADFVPYPAYQDESQQLTVPVSWSGPVGRIVPRNLLAVTATAGSWAPQCSAATPFSYLGVDMHYATAPQLTVYGVDELGNQLANYKEGFARIASQAPSASNPGWSLSSRNLGNDGLALTVGATPSGSLGTWSTAGSGGLATYTLGETATAFGKTQASKVLPFTALIDLQLTSLVDPDGIGLSSPLTVTPQGHEIRYGHLTSSHVYGPADSALSLPFWSQYWNGVAFVNNAQDDGCTQLLTTWFTLNNTSFTEPVAVSLRQGSGVTSVSRVASGSAVSGASAISFSAPGANASGYVDVLPTASLPVWLQEFWDGASLGPLPAPRATFGLYKGNSRLIYRRELAP